MGTPEARAEWNAWRESEPNQRTDLSVSRRPPKSPEPPSLVLMRDHFAVLMSAAIVFSSLLFAALAIAGGPRRVPPTTMKWRLLRTATARTSSCRCGAPSRFRWPGPPVKLRVDAMSMRRLFT